MAFARKLVALVILPSIAGAATLYLKKGEIHPDNHGKAELERPGPRWSAGRSHVILQFRHALNEDLLQQLNQRGAYIVHAVPDFGVMVSVGDDFNLNGLDVQWTHRLGFSEKVSPILDHRRTSGDVWVVAEFFSDVDMDRARRLSEAAGFQVHDHPDLMKTHVLLSGPADRVSGLAQWDELAYIFPASRALIRGQRVTPCGGALTSAGLLPMYVAASSGWPKDSNGQVTLSYVFGDMTTRLDPAQARQEIVRALNSWTAYAPIKFILGQSATATRTVFVKFATYNHGDGYPFDGSGGVLAHTFYPAPPNPESIAGDMHLDGSEDWHIGANIDLYTVAVHEAGHALGLAHTDNPAALMYPYYRLGTKISADDIAGIQSIYGGVRQSPPPVTAPLTLTITSPAPNSSTANAAVSVAGTVSGADASVRVTWQTDHGAGGNVSGGGQWNVASVPLVTGSNTITVTATDASHKVAQAVTVMRTAQPTSTAGATPPSLTITSPAANVVTTNAGVIDVRGTGSLSVSRVTWQSSAGAGAATGTANWLASSVPLLVGDNTIIVRAYDAAGNMAWRSVLVIRN